VGVPEITPVAVFNVSPPGSAGETEYDSIVPFTAGVFGTMARPLIYTAGFIEYERFVGFSDAVSVTLIEIRHDVLP
jgi:hypothetical protein